MEMTECLSYAKLGCSSQIVNMYKNRRKVLCYQLSTHLREVFLRLVESK